MSFFRFVTIAAAFSLLLPIMLIGGILYMAAVFMSYLWTELWHYRSQPHAITAGSQWFERRESR